METLGHIYYIPLSCGALFVIIALITLFFPPKRINDIYGYRTKSSKSSAERWHFAQRYSSLRMLEGGAFLMAVSFLGIPFPLGHLNQVIIGLCLIFLVPVYLMLRTESALNKKFPK